MNKMKWKLIIILGFVFSANAGTIKSVRCGQKVVKVGDPVSSAYKYCKKLKRHKDGNIYYKTYGHTPKKFIVRSKKIVAIKEIR